MARGVDGRDIYTDDNDRIRFLRLIEKAASETGASVLAYCLMSNHFHLAIKVGAVPLSAILQRILTSYSLTFNLRHDRQGHLFQARYKAILCVDDSYLSGLIRYIHLNPVRAGLVSKPEDWVWSSHLLYRKREKNGLVPDEADLPDFNPWPNPPETGIPSLLRGSCEGYAELSRIAEPISNTTGISIDELRSGSRRRDVVAAKKRLVQEAAYAGHRLAAVADWLGLTSSALTRYTRENTAEKCKPDT